MTTSNSQAATAQPHKVPIAIFWGAFLGGLILVLAAYCFESNAHILDKIATVIFYAPIFLFLIPPFISMSLILFSRKPIVEVVDGLVRLPIIGFGISRSDVLAVTPQRSGMSEHWRVVVELRTAKRGMIRAWLLWPVAYAFGRKLFILPLFLAEPRAEIKIQMVEALSPQEP